MWLSVSVGALVWAPLSAFVQAVEARSADWSMFRQFRGSIPEAGARNSVSFKSPFPMFIGAPVRGVGGVGGGHSSPSSA